MKTQLTIFIAGTLVAGVLASAWAQPALKDVFKNDFLIGAAVNQWQFSGASNSEVEIIEKHFNTVSPENVLKWGAVHPRPGQYVFVNADRYVEFGQKHGMFIIGHTLVWHAQTPRWVFQEQNGKPLTREALLERMRDHYLATLRVASPWKELSVKRPPNLIDESSGFAQDGLESSAI